MEAFRCRCVKLKPVLPVIIEKDGMGKLWPGQCMSTMFQAEIEFILFPQNV